MSRVEVFQNKVRQRLAGAGLEFDRIDSYGQLVTAKLLTEKINQPARLYAYGILDVFPEGEVYDYFQCVAMDGREYLAIRFTPGELDTPPPAVNVERQWIKRPAKAKPQPKVKPQPKPAAPQPVVAKPAPSPEPAVPQPAAGEIAWAIIPKADGSRLKQAKCKVVAVHRDRVEVEITKTGRQFQVPPHQVFNHVPHLVNGTWQ